MAACVSSMEWVKEKCLDRGGIGLVGGGIGSDSGGKLGTEMQRGAEERGDGEEVMEAHG